jgi:hypothetical protein
MSGGEPSTLTDRIPHLRALALLDPGVSALQVATVDMLEEVAESLDALRGRLGHQGDTDQGDDHLGSI